MIALGFFDGVHTGHGALLRRVGERAAALDAVPAAVTFDNHPDTLITGQPVPLINSIQDRAWLMEQYYGIRQVIVTHFDDRMMHMWRAIWSGSWGRSTWWPATTSTSAIGGRARPSG